MTDGWKTDRLGQHKASLTPAIDLVVRRSRELSELAEYSIRIANLTEVRTFETDDAAKAYAEDRACQLLTEALGRLHVLQENG